MPVCSWWHHEQGLPQPHASFVIFAVKDQLTEKKILMNRCVGNSACEQHARRRQSDPPSATRADAHLLARALQFFLLMRPLTIQFLRLMQYKYV